MAKKVKFNIRNFHYALENTTQTTSVYGTPVAIPGLRSISLDPNGETTKWFADGVKYFVTDNNLGYEGEIELAMLTDAFLKDVLQNALDSNNNLVEEVINEAKKFAFGFTVDSNDGPINYWFYNATASRPSIEGETKEEGIDPQTDTISLSTSPIEVGGKNVVRVRSTDSSTVSNWFSAVVMPSYTSGGSGGSGDVQG